MIEQRGDSRLSEYWRPNAGFGMRALLLTITASAVLNVVMAHKLSQLREAIAALKTESRLKAGQDVPALRGTDVDGKAITLDVSTGSTPTLLYAFTPECIWCKRNLPNVLALHTALRGQCRVIGVALNSKRLREYLEVTRLPFSIITNIDASTQRAYGLGGTPHTLLISKDGTFAREWIGAYTKDNIRELEETLSVRLTTLSAVEK